MSENCGFIHFIDQLERISLPKEVYDAVQWVENQPIEIFVNKADKEVFLIQDIPSCSYCGNSENLKHFHERHICADCRKSIAKL